MNRNEWSKAHLFGKQAEPPFSFVYGGQPSSALLHAWPRHEENMPSSAGRHGRRIVWTDPVSGLRVTCEMTTFDDFPALDWVVRLENSGGSDTPVLEQVFPLDAHAPLTEREPVALHHSNGSTALQNDFQPFVTPLAPGASVKLAPNGGRSSDGCFPYFNLTIGDGGLVGAVGWSGQWQLLVERLADGALVVKGGQQEFRSILHAGESIRTPRFLLLDWQGDRLDGHNQFRRLIYRHYTPLVGGRKPLPYARYHPYWAFGDGASQTTEKYLHLIRTFAPLGCELFDICAGWNGADGPWGEETSWEPRATAHPDGLEPIGAAVRDAGVKLSLWFDPERFTSSSPLVKEHPGWLLYAPGGCYRGWNLVNLGLAEVQDWLINLFSRYVEDTPLDCLLYDFNIDPLRFWRNADTPNRVGMTEIRYVEGFYRVLDVIHARYPNLLLDLVASGGRRMDFECLSRCHSYWNTDCYHNPVANQGMVHGVSLYLPGNYLGVGGVIDYGDAPYAFRSMLPGVANCAWSPWDPHFAGHEAAYRTRVTELKAIRHLAVGDYYPLTPYSLMRDQWMASQFHRPEQDDGVVLAFRRENCAEAVATFRLRGLDPAAHYEVTNVDVEGTTRVSGKQLMEKGLTIEIKDQPFQKLPGPEGSLTLPAEGVAFGPFSKEDGVPTCDQLRRVPTELKLGDARAVGKTVAFDTERVVDLDSILGGREEKVAFIYIPFKAGETGQTTFGFGADWWYEAYLDGELISETLSTSGNRTHPPTVRDHMASVAVTKGEHLLVLRFIRGRATALLAVGCARDLEDKRRTAPGAAVIMYKRLEPNKQNGEGRAKGRAESAAD